MIVDLRLSKMNQKKRKYGKDHLNKYDFIDTKVIIGVAPQCVVCRTTIL